MYIMSPIAYTASSVYLNRISSTLTNVTPNFAIAAALSVLALKSPLITAIANPLVESIWIKDLKNMMQAIIKKQ